MSTARFASVFLVVTSSLWNNIYSVKESPLAFFFLSTWCSIWWHSVRPRRSRSACSGSCIRYSDATPMSRSLRQPVATLAACQSTTAIPNKYYNKTRYLWPIPYVNQIIRNRWVWTVLFVWQNRTWGRWTVAGRISISFNRSRDISQYQSCHKGKPKLPAFGLRRGVTIHPICFSSFYTRIPAISIIIIGIIVSHHLFSITPV